jgi:hypothetical protein
MLNASLLDVPRPFLDPIHSLVEAVGISSLVMERPIRNRTYALVLDTQHRGLGILHASDINLMTAHYLIGRMSDIPDAHAAVLISTRVLSCIQPGDIELLSLLNTTFSHAGFVLHDWVVAGRGGLYCPRSLTDSPDPWGSSAVCL